MNRLSLLTVYQSGYKHFLPCNKLYHGMKDCSHFETWLSAPRLRLHKLALIVSGGGEGPGHGHLSTVSRRLMLGEGGTATEPEWRASTKVKHVTLTDFCG